MKAVRQFLSYFFEIYSFSAVSRQQQVQQVSMKVINYCMDLKTRTPDMIPINQVIQHLIDWTDCRRLIQSQESSLNFHYKMVSELLDLCLDEHPGKPNRAGNHLMK